MPSLDDLKKRIKSVKSTQKITKAMKMVAAAKLKKAQDNAEKGRPYSEKIQNIIFNLTKSISDPSNAPKLLTGNGNSKIHLCLVMTADRGLCGGFNTNICQLAKQHINLSFKEKKQITFKEANEIGKKIIDLFERDQFDKCYLFYNNFKNVITQIPHSEQIIPAPVKEKETTKEDKPGYEFEPDEDEILEDLLPKNISTQIYKAFLENAASEQGSRMTAMDNATRNAGDLVDKLTINYNRSRQASITKELIEIISGAESL